MQEDLRKIKDNYEQLEDLFSKAAAHFFGTEMLHNLGITKKMKAIAPTELVHLEARRLEPDFNFIMEDEEWYHFEFESDGITKEDLMRFREYEAITSRVYGVPVTTFVICSSPIRKLMSEINLGVNTYKVKLIRLKDGNADQVFQTLEKEDYIDKKKLFPMLLTPLMSGEILPKERIFKGINLLRKDSRVHITEEENRQMQAMLYALAVKLLTREELEEIKEVFGMTILGEMLVASGIEKGIEKGIVQGTERINLLNMNLIREKRFSDLERSTNDQEFQKRLLEEYGIQ